MRIIILFFISFLSFASKAQDTISAINKKRLIPVATGVVGLYTVSMVGLNEVWYKNNPRSSFHFFDDSNEWKQMDKIGHATTSFHESRFAVDVLKWSGVPKKKAYIIGGLAGFVFQTPIEFLDAYSSEYGFSWTDVAANASGSALVIGQYLLWDELRIQPKFSFHKTKFAKERPNVLGKSLNEQLLKDYNGQTYWLSFNILSFLPNKESRFPKWLNVSLGYSAENMIYAQDVQNKAAGYDPYRQYFLSLDIDFTKIRTRSKVLNFIFDYGLNILHVPAPALEYSRKGFKFHPVYF
ncbi:MAG: DUF2279 domain-containing protein [Sporocytophaga sp.]|uniref:DUF2279 domain-containing protein n=1 Tax=Sporocytophaga sp. TaxID=2231183 RepID=UPI001B013875|nr:DUF2279 domain-containing protein [Sporocytophaga sp.]MBO9701156.1 DUF2279 domain-containing protein [Sporocytophaga sp.]